MMSTACLSLLLESQPDYVGSEESIHRLLCMQDYVTELKARSPAAVPPASPPLAATAAAAVIGNTPLPALHRRSRLAGIKLAMIDPVMDEAAEAAESGAVRAAHMAERAAELADAQALRTHAAALLAEK